MAATAKRTETLITMKSAIMKATRIFANRDKVHPLPCRRTRAEQRGGGGIDIATVVDRRFSAENERRSASVECGGFGGIRIVPSC